MTMEVPRVTIDDLASFHQAHFSDSAGPIVGQFAPGLASDSDNCTEDLREFYPDGQQRTLTDEQIAIFRHSEIQDIIKAFRYAAAQEEEDEEEEDGTRRSEPEILVETPTAAADQGPEPINTKAAASSPLIVSKNAAIDAKSSKRDKEHHDRLLTQQKQRSAKRWKNKKRQYNMPKQDVGAFKAEGDERTFRRIAREADEMRVTDVDLDY